ncbi:MAG: hypothetical protein ABS939_24065 [Psychrobacillus sp.]
MTMKLRINFQALEKSLKHKSLDELDDMCVTFMIYGHNTPDNKYYYKDMQKACNMIIRELIKRGRDEEEEIQW